MLTLYEGKCDAPYDSCGLTEGLRNFGFKVYLTCVFLREKQKEIISDPVTTYSETTLSLIRSTLSEKKRTLNIYHLSASFSVSKARNAGGIKH
jgi:hypothetical protein